MTSRGLRGPVRGGGGGGPAIGRLPLSVWVVVVVAVVVCWAVAPPVSGSVHLILWGRCYSYCLHQHLQQHSLDSGETEVDTLPRNPIRACQRHPACRWCLYVCERPEDTFADSASCHRDCRHTRTRTGSRGREACSQACNFLAGAGRLKGGTCPAPGTLRGFQSACVDSCGRDAACDRAAEKCCGNGCGSVCTEPEDIHILPPVPGDLHFKMLKTGGVLISWQPGHHRPPPRAPRPQSPEHPTTPPPATTPGADTGRRRVGDGQRGTAPGEGPPPPPAVYIFRWWCPYTPGAVTSVTDRPRTRLQGYPSGLYPGSKCHFMVAAVNLHGSRGFSRVSPYIKQFLLPSPPLHLEQVKSRVHDGKVDVTIQWQPPVYTDGLPVHRYQVSWSGSLPRASASYMRLHMNKRVLDADQHSFVLHSLNLGTIYFVQVRAVVRWKRRQKVGKPASAYIETYAPPQQASDAEREDSVFGGGRGSSIIQSVRVNQTFYDHTVLKTQVTWTLKPGKNARKYLIYWKAETCAQNEHRKTHPRLETSATSHARSFTLYNLKPQCEYAVRVHAVTSRGRTGAATVTSFLTPSCHLIPVKQGEAPDCHTSETPEEVQGLHAETSGCLTVVRWLAPSSPSTALQAYDVMWGTTEAGGFSAATVIYTSEPRRLTVLANSTYAELGRLRAGDHYTVQVRGVSVEGGEGPPALLPLRVPHPDQPCSSSSSSSSSSSLSSSTVRDKDVPSTQPVPPATNNMTSPEAAGGIKANRHRPSSSTGHDDLSKQVTSPPPNPSPTSHLRVDSTRDLTAHRDVTADDEDDDEVYFSGGGSGGDGGAGDSDSGRVKETDFYLITRPTPPPRQPVESVDPVGGNSMDADSRAQTDVSTQLGGKVPGSTRTPFPASHRDRTSNSRTSIVGGESVASRSTSSPPTTQGTVPAGNQEGRDSPAASSAAGGRGGGGGGVRTCWFSRLSSVLLLLLCVCVSVCVCVCV